MNTTLNYPDLDDGRLIELHLTGHAPAFREIVGRYQAMICALAYSACGDVARSEDLAQEVFIAAWKQLPQLREPARLRAWLCGIARNLIHNARRRQQRTPTARAEPLSPETPAAGANPREHAIGTDEAALLWRTLAELPENYREPMVLYYREHGSTPAVAAALEISEDAVRQRLARGRAMLSERMAKLVEETLGRSAPSPAFTGAVLIALPLGVTPAALEATAGATAATGTGPAAKALTTAGAVGSAAVKGGLAVKALAAVAALPALLNGITDYLRFRAQFEAPANPAARRAAILGHVWPAAFNAAAIGIIAFLIFGRSWSHSHPLAFGALLIVMIAAFVLSAVYYGRLKQRQETPAGARAASPGFEYRSRGGWLGLPWVHVHAGGPLRRRTARGWIAVSDGVAVGGLFASAPYCALAPVGVGGVAVGLLTVGGVAIGLGALGATAAGIWAVGGLAVASQAAQGGLVLARDFAAGQVAVAPHANDAAAAAFFQQHIFFGFTKIAAHVAIWAAFLGWLPPLALMGWQLWRTRPPR